MAATAMPSLRGRGMMVSKDAMAMAGPSPRFPSTLRKFLAVQRWSPAVSPTDRPARRRSITRRRRRSPWLGMARISASRNRPAWVRAWSGGTPLASRMLSARLRTSSTGTSTDQISYRIGGPYGVWCFGSRQKRPVSVGKFPVLSAANDTADRQIARPSGLAEEVYRRIRADIISLKLPPDTRVSVDSLARELSVSQTPIREALSMLEANGLVSKRHFAGYATSPRRDRAQLDELFEFRLLIEPHAARKAAGAMADTDIAALASGEQAPSHDAFADIDTEFHRLIAQGAQNHLIADSLARLHIHVHI